MGSYFSSLLVIIILHFARLFDFLFAFKNPRYDFTFVDKKLCVCVCVDCVLEFFTGFNLSYQSFIF